MCKEFKMLVEQSDWRYAAQCEHGTVHLRWGHVTISLAPHDFTALARMVLAEYALLQPQSGRMRLNVDQVFLEFPTDDFQPLLRLMQQTVEKLQSPQQLQATLANREATKITTAVLPISSKWIYLN